MEHNHCSLCGADNTRMLFKRKDFLFRTTAEKFTVVRCRECGLAYVAPRPTAEEIHAYYPEEFYDTNIDAEGLLAKKQRQLELKYRYVQDIPPGRLLDIGCQKGEFMFYMQQRGWEVHGTDFSSKPPNVFGLDIFHGELDAAGFPPESFDLITLWAVLEHAYEPKRMLARVNRLLKPGGRVVLLVTNFNSLPARFMRQDDIPRHTTLFTKSTLGRMLRSAGFVPEAFYFNYELYGGSNRGVLNYLFKLCAGEKLDDIVAMNRSTNRWHEFSSQLHGKDSKWMLKVDGLDIALAPYLDRWCDRLQLGFLLIARGTRMDDGRHV